MKLPEASPEELMQKFMQTVPQVHKTSSDTGITTPGAIATVIIGGIIFAELTPLWLLLAVPLALVGWGSEVKWWKKT